MTAARRRREKSVEKFIDRTRPYGYVVVGYSRVYGSRVWPIYRGDLHVLVAQPNGREPLRHVFSTYEQGTSLNGLYSDDPAGANLATIAAQAIAALDEHARVRAAQAAAAKPPQKRKKRR